MRGAIVLFACAGCIEPSFVRCGDQICPPSNICLDDAVCATPEQIAACADLADAASCHTATSGDGYCTHGVCAPNVCGDDQVTGIEPCDGTTVSLTCADFGYYTGTTSCSPLCTIDRSGCSGRCGDGVIDSDQGEECDRAPPTESCVDVGYDYGALTCGVATCVGDPAHSCSRYGWHAVGAITYPAQVVGDAGMFAALNTAFIEVHDPTVSTHPGMYVAIDARAGDLLAATSSTVEQYHAGVWTTLPSPTLQGGQKIVEANIATDGTPHVLVTDATTCAIGWFDGAAWTFAPGPAGCSHLAARAIGDFAVAVSDGSVRRQFPGCSPAPGNPCECLRMYTIGDGTATIFALDIQATDTNVYARQASSNTITSTIAPECGGGPSSVTLGTSSAMRFVLRAPGEVFAMPNSAFNNTAFRIANNRVETIASATSITGEPPDLYATRDGVVYAQGDGTLYRLEGLTETQRVPTTDLVQPLTSRLALAADGTYVTCAEHVTETTSASATFQTLGSLTCPPGTGCCTALYARSATSIYAAMAPGATPQLAAWNGATWTTQMLGGVAIGKVISLAGAGSVVAGVRDTGDVIETTGGAWMVLPALPGVSTAAVVAVANDGTIYAAGRAVTGGVVWEYGAGGWFPVHLHDDPTLGYTSLSVASDGSLFAAIGESIDVGVGATWTSYDNAGAVVAAVSATDAFSTTAAVPVHVNHWDGSRWAPLNVNVDDFYFAVAASASDVALLGSLRVSNPNPVWQGFIRVPH